MSRDLILGIDTSNYTTSVAILTAEGELVANLKRPLTVKPGERGLRQSDAVFAHTVNIPSLMREAKEHLDGGRIVAVGVSERPRNVDGSYMPCFLSGVASAESISAISGIPLYRFSHQCGHIMAAIYSSGRSDLLDSDFAALHVSGGTTELVRVSADSRGFKTELVGGSADLNAGQIIDRIGVYAGLKFPCGAALEIEALKNTKKIPKRKISSKGMMFNLSGLENMATALLDETGDVSLVGAFVFDFIGRSILSIMDSYTDSYGEGAFVLAGGVMCNSVIKRMISEKYDASFAEPAMSADNAVGIAALTLRAFNAKKE